MYVIKTDNKEIDWNATGIKKKLQNINNLLCILKGEIPYMRSLGRDLDNVDSSIAKIRYRLIEETYDIINDYAPDAKIYNVDVIFKSDIEPIIKVVISFE